MLTYLRRFFGRWKADDAFYQLAGHKQCAVCNRWFDPASWPPEMQNPDCCTPFCAIRQATKTLKGILTRV